MIRFNIKRKVKRIVYIIIVFIKCKIQYISHKVGKKGINILINTPTHGNLGDHAIAIAEIEFFGLFLKDYAFLEIDGDSIRNNLYIWKKIIKPSDVICISGGGYLGDLWMNEENLVLDIISSFASNKIVILPQTVHYNMCSENEYLFRAQKIYSEHKENLLVCLREQKSYGFFEKHFPFVGNKYLCPDMVLFLNKEKDLHRQDVLLCFRDDREKISHGIEQIISVLDDFKLEYNQISTVEEHGIRPDERNIYLDVLLKKIASSKLVITDRLHAMLFCVITATPCIAFDNISGKVSGTYEWIKHLDYIKLCSDSKNIESLVDNLMRHESELTYNKDVVLNYYSELASKIINMNIE